MSLGLLQDLFDLMLGLSTQNDRTRILNAFCGSMGEIFPELQFRYHSPEADPPECVSFPLHTVTDDYGCVAVEGPLEEAVAEDELPLVQQAMDYLAVLLEREEQAVQLAAYKSTGAAGLESCSQELLRVHERLHRTLNAIGSHLYVADLETNEVLFANECMRQKLGGEITGRKCWEAIGGRNSACPGCPLTQENRGELDETTPMVWESFSERDNRWYQNQTRILDWGNDRKAQLTLSTDITEHKQSESDLERWGQIFKYTGMGVSVTGKKYELAMVNPAYARMHGYEQEELLGKSATELFPAGYSKTLSEHIRALEERDSYTFEMPRQRKDGSQFPAQIDITSIRDEQGGVLYRVANIQDISERKEQEQRILAAKERAEAASKAKDEFLSNMSHEIRTPLNGIFGMLQLAQTAELDPELDEYVATAMSTARNLKTILDDLLDLSRMEAGKMRLHPAPFSLRDSLRTVLGNFSVQAQNKNLRLDSVVHRNVPPTLIGDDARLRQILFNIVGNAVKFTPEGEVEVTAQALPHSPTPDHVNVLIIIRDTGIGIPPERVDHLFENFTQMDGSFTRRYGGTGLGLGIVRRIVRMMRGTIAVESEPGHGSSIYLSLPLEREQHDCDMGEELCRMIKEQPLRILLAEDDRVSVLAMRRFLHRLGHTPTTAANGREALELLRREQFDAVLMDIRMPLLNGLELTRLIRSGEAGKNSETHIIALTAHAMQGDREAFLDAGMDDYLAKPVDMDTLCFALLKAMPRQ
ncbi:MAG: ATP-binding protein [Desulfovibrio sp.]|nr:ATP-binding protein [Desulfovibrio sp.]